MTGKNEAKDVVAATNDFKLTLEEKSSLADGTDGPCGGNIAPIPRLNFKGICLQDSPLGVREADFVTIFSAGITAGASFDRAMIRERGLLMAEEFRAKGINIAWSPVAGPLGRSALGGRNWEGFGADPYLAGIAVSETIAAFTEHGVQTNIKHFIGNEQRRCETLRCARMGQSYKTL
ncbi:beta-glucosidase [Fusarium oxysporum f. sp. melonis 26406]|uniref:beta-glucosidase n=1 Tax=Fusarium oxysporum f. sp. melonis 26406 TaxID=1089452 RepID=W9Z634_FUSOX|nr:beta-glucosidase [Fusarium oxysporum f. sp. melonis 26406]